MATYLQTAYFSIWWLPHCTWWGSPRRWGESWTAWPGAWCQTAGRRSRPAGIRSQTQRSWWTQWWRPLTAPTRRGDGTQRLWPCPGNSWSRNGEEGKKHFIFWQTWQSHHIWFYQPVAYNPTESTQLVKARKESIYLQLMKLGAGLKRRPSIGSGSSVFSPARTIHSSVFSQSNTFHCWDAHISSTKSAGRQWTKHTTAF